MSRHFLQLSFRAFVYMHHTQFMQEQTVSLHKKIMNQGVLHFRKCFHIGGKYQPVASESNKSTEAMVEQMYVEELRPLDCRNVYPIVFWPGMGQTGTGWVTTPDGRPGWASYLLSHGHTVYIVDVPERGRSAWLPDSSKLISISPEYAERFWTATSTNGQLWPQANLHTQWPGTGRKGDEVFDNFMMSQVQATNDYARAEALARHLGGILLDKVGPAILCTHSQGGSHGWVIADLVPDLVKAIVALEPTGPPFTNRIASVIKTVDSREIKRPYGITITPISYDPPLADGQHLAMMVVPSKDSSKCETITQRHMPRRLTNLSRIPVLVVTSESGYHAFYDHTTVAFLRQGGVDVTWLDLPGIAVKGNGHFMFLEKNSTEIVEHIHKWLRQFEDP